MNATYTCSVCRAAIFARRARLSQARKRRFTSFGADTSQQQLSNRASRKDDPGAPKATGPTRTLRYSGREVPEGSLTASNRLSELFAETASSRSQTPRPSQPRIRKFIIDRVAWNADDFHKRDNVIESERPEALINLVQDTEALQPEAVIPPKAEPLPKSFLKENLDALKSSPSPVEAIAIIQRLCDERHRLSTLEWILLKRDAGLNEQLDRFVSARTTKQHDHDAPSLYQVVQLYDAVGAMYPRRLRHVLNSVIINLLREIVAQKQNEVGAEAQGAEHEAKTITEQAEAHAGHLLKELLDVWRAMCGVFLPAKQDASEPRQDWEDLPTLESILDILGPGRSSFEKRFAKVLNGPYNQEVGYHFASNALMTLFCFRRVKEMGLLHTSCDGNMFVAFIESLVTGENRAKPAAMSEQLLGASLPHILKDERINLSRMVRDELAGQTFRTEPAVTRMGVIPAQEFNIKSSKLFADLRKATREEDVRFISKLWSRHLELSKDKDDEYLSLMYGEFLWSFVHVVQIEKAIEVWTTLKERGIEPSISHWTAMLEACKRQRDVQSLREIWKQLQETDHDITNTAWATYIDALLHLREWQEGVEAVQSLIETWNTRLGSTSRDAIDITKDAELGPAIGPINAAVSGLLSLGQTEVAESLFAYAREQNIPANIATFNIRLRSAVRKNDSARVQQILADLRASTCSPDVITFTILVDGIFRNRNSDFGVQTTAEQQAAVDEVFADMEAAGIQATARTYAVMLDSVLQGGRPNIPTARAVLERMARQKVPVSPHIYSILIQHYFNSQPPDLGALQSLWQQLEQQRTVPDHVIFDRMIEGYAKLGEQAEMMRFLYMMPRRGKLPGWVALSAALRCLVQQDRIDIANKLVRDVEQQRGVVRLGVRRGWRGEAEFKGMVEELRRRGIIEPREPDGEKPEVTDIEGA